MGARAPGWYNLDPSGNMKNNDDVFYCKDGWTYIMQRQPKDVKLRGSVKAGSTGSWEPLSFEKSYAESKSFE